uniref:Uncharacterized protein n=1 Tax=Arundo donax TaxID=35708 RepID=A0A0A9B5Y0_ARUDO
MCLTKEHFCAFILGSGLCGLVPRLSFRMPVCGLAGKVAIVPWGL